MADSAQHLQPHKLQLRSFLLGMAQTIKTVTHLVIDATPVGDGSTQRLEAIAACFDVNKVNRASVQVSTPGVPVGPCVAGLLLAFAQACPAVQKLEVLGVVGQELFSAFGVSCSNLSSLVLTGCALGNLTQPLVKLMPHLINIQLTRTAPYISAELSCMPLLHGSSLIHIDVGLENVTAELWNALPALQVLRGGFNRRVLPELQPKPCLCNLQLVCTMDDHFITLAKLAAVLRAAPRLKRLVLEATDPSLKPYVWLERVLALDLDLGYVHDRLTDGLTSTSPSGGSGEEAQGISLFMEDDEQWPGDEDPPTWGHSGVTNFFNSCPPMPAFTGLKVQIEVDVAYTTDERLSSGLAATFPNLTDLELDDLGIDEDDLVSLAACTSLRFLTLMEADVTALQLATLVPRLPALEQLRVEGSKRFYKSDSGLDDLQSLLEAWGSAVKVIDMKTR